MKFCFFVWCVPSISLPAANEVLTRRWNCFLHFQDALSNLDASKAPLNMDSRIIELEFEKDRLTSRLSTCVNQEEFLALKETLAYSQETQSSYKVTKASVSYFSPDFPTEMFVKGLRFKWAIYLARWVVFLKSSCLLLFPIQAQSLVAFLLRKKCSYAIW